MMNVLKKGIFKNLSLYVGSNIVGQIIALLVSPILTRIFSPESYGVQNVYLAFISMLCVVSTLSYHSAIVVSEKDEERSIVALSFIILIIITFIICIFLVFFRKKFLLLLNCEQIIPYSFLVPISVFSISSYNILSQYAIKYKYFPLISKTKVKQNIYGNIAKILFGLFNFGTVGLLIGNVFAQSVGGIELLKKYIKDKKMTRYKLSKKKVIEVGIRYRKFAYISTPCNYIYTFGSQIPVLMLSILFDNKISGYYGLAYSAVFLPCNLIGLALSQVFYAEIAEKRREKDIILLINMIVRKTILFSIIPFILIGILAPYIFTFIYGKDWHLAGEFARILAIQSFFYFIILPVNKVFEVFQKQLYDLILNILRIAILLLVFYIAKKIKLNPIETILAFSVFGGLVYVVLLIMMEIMLKKELAK